MKTLLLIIITTLFVVSCSTDKTEIGNINIKNTGSKEMKKNEDFQYPQWLIDYENEIKNAGYNPLSCVNISEIKQINNPVDIYIGFVKCVEEEKYEKAMKMRIIAKVFGIYDSLRVVDTSAHQAIIVLDMSILGRLSEIQKQKFVEGTQDKIQDPEYIKNICEQIDKIGNPNYYPDYMIKHGMGAMKSALEGKKVENGLIVDFDAEKSWEETLEKYLHCKESQKEGWKEKIEQKNEIRRKMQSGEMKVKSISKHGTLLHPEEGGIYTLDVWFSQDETRVHMPFKWKAKSGITLNNVQNNIAFASGVDVLSNIDDFEKFDFLSAKVEVSLGDIFIVRNKNNEYKSIKLGEIIPKEDGSIWLEYEIFE